MKKKLQLFLLLFIMSINYIVSQSFPTIHAALNSPAYAIQFNMGPVAETEFEDYPDSITILASDGVTVITYTAGEHYDNGVSNVAVYNTPLPEPWKGDYIDSENFVANFAEFGIDVEEVHYIDQEVSLLSNEEFDAIDAIKIYPTPINKDTNSNITISGIKEADILIRDLFGKIVLTATLENNTVDISSLIRGIYLITVNTTNGTTTKKIIIN